MARSALVRRTPSMIEAWLSSSLMTRSPSPSDRPQHAGVGGEARLEDERRLGVLEGGQLALQLFVDGHGADDGAHGAGAHAPVVDGLLGGLRAARGGWSGPGSCWRRG